MYFLRGSDSDIIMVPIIISVLLIVLFLVLSLIISFILSRRRAFLVLKEFKLYKESKDGVRINITGRPAGLLGFLLTILKIHPETNFIVSTNRITIKEESQNKNRQNIIPLSNVSSIHSYYTKPFAILVLGILQVIISFFYLIMAIISSPVLILGFIFLLILAAICYGIYWFSQKMTILIETCGGLVFGLSIKRGIIENQKIDIRKAVTAINIVVDEIQKNQSTISH